MIKKLKKILFYDTYSDIDRDKIWAQIKKENRRFSVIWASFQMMYWAYCLIMSTRNHDFMICREIYFASFIICAAALVIAVFAADKASWLIQPVAFAIDAAFLGAGIGIACSLATKTIVIFASVLVVPVFFICDSFSTMMLLILNTIVFAAVGSGRMDADTFQWTLENLILFSSIGFILGYFVNKARFERFYFAESAVQLADLQKKYAYYDQLTGLLNRRAYAEMIDDMEKKLPADCCVIMADINGLKEINDTLGHDAGDELITGSAICLRKSFAGIDLIYRIGGDEFCVMINNKNEEYINGCLQQLEISTGGWKGKYVNGISISYGYAMVSEFSELDLILKAADKRMYEFKSNYYRNSQRGRAKK